MNRVCGTLLAGLVLAAGCARGSIGASHVITAGSRPAYAGNVTLLMRGTETKRSFSEIGLVQALGSGPRANRESVLAQLQSRARALGANGLVQVQLDHGGGFMSATGVAVYFEP